MFEEKSAGGGGPSVCVCARAGIGTKKKEEDGWGGRLREKEGEGERERGREEGGNWPFGKLPFFSSPLSHSLSLSPSLSLSLPLYRSLSDFSPFFLSACCPRRRRRPRPRRCRRPCRRCGSSVTWSPRLKACSSKALAASPKCG